MPWGAAIAAGAAIVGSKMQSDSAEDASNAQQASSQAGIDSQERMFDKSIALQQPYMDAGYGALTGLQGLTTTEGRAQALQGYYGGQEFAEQQKQQESQAMRNAAMTGGVRSGNNQVALASIAPQLGQNYLSNQYNQLTGLANMGMGASSQGAQSANYLGSSMNQAQQNIGQAQAQNYLAQGNIASNTIGTLGGIASQYYGQGG
tara:strand:+ start:2147 stop:2758 length:612 start_codon:yes stop_codon:yes gene_type:complete